MDIISIWSQWHSLTPEQIADKEFVQKIKGTKVGARGADGGRPHLRGPGEGGSDAGHAGHGRRQGITDAVIHAPQLRINFTQQPEVGCAVVDLPDAGIAGIGIGHGVDHGQHLVP